MFKSKMMKGISLSLLAVSFSFFVGACSNKITEEQIQQLKELRQQERSFIDQIQKKQNEKNSLEKELNSRKSELNDCNKKLDFVKQKLTNWPNVWPDYEVPKQ